MKNEPSLDKKETGETNKKRSTMNHPMKTGVLIVLLALVVVLGLHMLHSDAKEAGANLNQQMALITKEEQAIEKPLSDGTYPLTDVSVQPLPSVVYNPSQESFQFEMEDQGKNVTITASTKQVNIQTTTGQQEVRVKGTQYTVYLHANEKISEITSSDSGGGFAKGIVAGIIVHHLLTH